jgi:anti-sigma regulatory factor (Ser/Thr protein kinase)
VGSSLQPQAQPSQLRNALFIGTDPEIAAILQDVLDPLSWHVYYASDNDMALAVTADMPFDLVITSESTSGRADVQLLHEIRKSRPHTCVIIVTGESTPPGVIASMRAGAFSYFSRPFSPSALARMVRFAVGSPYWDDGIKVLQGKREWIRILARCDMQTAERLIQFVHEMLGLPEPERAAIATAFREILMNAVEHGGRLRPDRHVEIDYIRSNHMVMCRVKDPGDGFALDKIEHAAIGNPTDDPLRHITIRAELGMRPGGYGVSLARRLVDDLIYSEKGNEVLLIKYINIGPVTTGPSDC